MTADLMQSCPVPLRRSGPFAEATPWQRHLVLLAGAILLQFALAGHDAAGMVAVWIRTGDFHHCFLILPIIAWLIWMRRHALRLLTPEFSLLGCAVLAGAMMLWLAGAASHVDVVRHAAFVICVQGLVLGLLGVPVARALLFPLGYALFLVPVGSEIEPWLQVVTAKVAVALLHVSEVPAVLGGVYIDTPAGLFKVAEACSGTSFLHAMAAYVALVCVLFFRSPLRRLIFFGIAMPAALLTNGLRAYGIMLIANLTSMRNPIVSDHLLYGWLLFACVMLVLTQLAARWFDRNLEAEPVDARVLQGIARDRPGAVLTSGLLLAITLVPRIWMGMTEGRSGELSLPPSPPQVARWTQAGPTSDWSPHFDGATWIGQWPYRDDAGRSVNFAVVVFDRQQEGRELVGFGQGAAAPEGAGIWQLAGAAPDPAKGRGEWLRALDGRYRYAATFYLVGGRVTGSHGEAKLASVLARLIHGQHGGLAVLVSAAAANGDGAGAERTAFDFIRDAGGPQQLADRALMIR